MKIERMMIFAYDFPHKKTQDFLLRLIVEGYKIDYCIAAPWKKLNIPASTIRLDQKHAGLVHPRLICEKFGINYLVYEHNSRQTLDFIKNNPVDLYIISGARILSKKIIEASQNRVLNIHPGLLPEVRGLDTLLWSIHYDVPLGITAHFITSKIDSGLLIYKEKLPLYKDDTPFDVTLRLLEHQSEVLIKSLNISKSSNFRNFKSLLKKAEPYNTKMPEKLEKVTIRKFKKWLKNYSE